MEKDGVLYLTGEAADDAILLKAGIRKAKGLVAALATDADNVFLVLTARQLNPDLTIIARAGDEKAHSKLQAAGANRVESPYDMGAASMAQRILRPTVTNFLKPDRSMLFNPSFEAVINMGDTVIAVGEDVNLQQLEKILNPAVAE